MVGPRMTVPMIRAKVVNIAANHFFQKIVDKRKQLSIIESVVSE